MTDTPPPPPPPPPPKHSPTEANNGMTSSFSPFRTQRAVAFGYGFTFAFAIFTVILVFDTSGYSSPWSRNVLHTSSYSSTYRSHFSSIFSYFFPKPLHPPSPFSSLTHNFSSLPNTTSQNSRRKEGVFDDNKNTTSQFSSSESKDTPSQISGKKENSTDIFSGNEQGLFQFLNYTANSTSPSQTNITSLISGESNVSSSEDLREKVSEQSCNIFDGRWVKDDSYPLYDPGSCPHIEDQFNCFLNGRPDAEFEKYRWQPNGCNIPRLNGGDMLELLRGKRLVFVGDSLNRNMWESLVCILRNSVKVKSRVFEASGRKDFRKKEFYSFVFKDYNCSVEFFRSRFFVQEWKMLVRNGSKVDTLQLDVIERSFDRYKTADILIFNTGHWWNHEKTAKGKGYYQESSNIYGQLKVKEAFHKALTTWARWVDANVNSLKTQVFFRGYSTIHFKGRRWNSGGRCDNETEPIKNEKYLLEYPPKMRILESVMGEMKTPVFYLNITRITDYRKDAHPSIFRKQNLTKEERRSPLKFQDCSHWCLPGVPDTWNELLYAQLLIKHNQKQQQQQQDKMP